MVRNDKALIGKYLNYMNNWIDYLLSQGGRHSATEPGVVGDFGSVLGPEALERGFAAAVWTHALYDVWVLVFR